MTAPFSAARGMLLRRAARPAIATKNGVAPTGRRAVFTSSAPVARSASIGAPPTDVDWGFPGARDEVRAFANRVDAQVSRMQTCFKEWLDASKAPYTDPTFITQWPTWYAGWHAWFSKIGSFDVMGPSPSQAWQRTQEYEKQLEVFRKRLVPLAQVTGTPVPPAPPKQSDGSAGFEEPGGVKRAGVPWTGLLIIGGLIAGAMFLREAKQVVPSLRGSSPAGPPPPPSPRQLPAHSYDPEAHSYDAPGRSYEPPASRDAETMQASGPRSKSSKRYSLTFEAPASTRRTGT